MINSPLSGVLISSGVTVNSVIAPSIASGITTGGVEPPSFFQHEIKLLNTKKNRSNRHIYTQIYIFAIYVLSVFLRNLSILTVSLTALACLIYLVKGIVLNPIHD